MLKILEKYFVKKSEYDKLLNSYSNLTSDYQNKEMVIHSLETKLLAKEGELKEANTTIKLLKKAVNDLTIELNDELENKKDNKKKEVDKNGKEKKDNITKPVSKRGRPRKSQNS